MHPPAQRGAPVDERLHQNVFSKKAREICEAAPQSLLSCDLPTPLPKDARWRLVEPHDVVIGHAPGCENHRECIDNKRRFEILQITWAGDKGAYRRPVQIV